MQVREGGNVAVATLPDLHGCERIAKVSNCLDYI
jgi:hypothetical protein